MTQIRRRHHSASQHVCPQPVRDVLVEHPVLAARRQFSELCPTAVFRSRRLGPGCKRVILVAWIDDGFGDLGFARQLRRHDVPHALDEHRFKRHIRMGLLDVIRLQRRPLHDLEVGARSEECQEAVIIGLPVIADQRMVVTLRALKVDAEEDPTDVAGHGVRFAHPVEEEPGLGSRGRVFTAGGEHLTNQHVVGLILLEGFQEVAHPVVGRDFGRRPPFHEHHVEKRGHVAGEMGRRQQAIDGGFPLVGGSVCEERFELLERRRHADEIDRNPPQKLAVARQRGQNADRIGRHNAVDLDVKRLLSPGRGWPDQDGECSR